MYSLDTSDILSNSKNREDNYLLNNKRNRSLNDEEEKEIKDIKERNELREIRKKT